MGASFLALLGMGLGGALTSALQSEVLSAVVLGLFFGLPDIGQPEIVRERDLHGVITT